MPLRTSVLAAAAALLCSGAASAAVVEMRIDGVDAIFLAGRTDIVVPPASASWSVLLRHGNNTPEELAGGGLEQHPDLITVAGGDVIRVADPAVGGVNFFNGFGAPIYGPGGNGVDGSNLNSLGGISGYRGPEGPLVGVFLDDTVPTGGAPVALNFTSSGLGTDFPTLSPLLKQIFYIGDGLTSTGAFQEFTAPAGATRLFLGIPDGFGFDGQPGAYDDNDGFYLVRIGVNQIPTIPEPGSLALVALALAGLGWAARSKKTPAKRRV